jgi:fumarate reductase flavoprotein subunit
MARLEADLVVIAAGASGLAASVAAAQLGLKVITLEKSSTTGGAANMGMGPLGIESRLTRAKQFSPTRDQAFEVFMNYVHWQADGRLVRAHLNKSGDTIAWLEDLGVTFAEPASYFPGSYPTWHIVQPESGNPGPTAAATMFKILTQKAKEFGVQLKLQSPVKRLLKEDGRIVGVVAEDRSGEEFEVAAKAVIVATGGFGDNPKMIKKHTGFDWGRDLHTFRIPGLEGDGIRMAWEAGAMSTPMHMELSFGVADPIQLGLEWLPLFHQPHLMLNLLGERFINEAEGNDSFKGNAIALQKDRQCFFVFDEELKDGMKDYLDFINLVIQTPCLSNIDEMIAKAVETQYPHLFIADSLEELAAKTGMHLPGLEATLEEYNGYCQQGYDEVFLKPKRYLRPVQKPPYYALRLFPAGYGSLGGIKINYKTEVLDKNWEPIQGLYACGTDACDIYGDTYVFQLPGNTMGFAMTTGRMAAENAAKYIETLSGCEAESTAVAHV